MLLTTICFLIGAPVQTVCKSIQSGEIYSKVGDNNNLIFLMPPFQHCNMLLKWEHHRMKLVELHMYHLYDPKRKGLQAHSSLISTSVLNRTINRRPRLLHLQCFMVSKGHLKNTNLSKRVEDVAPGVVVYLSPDDWMLGDISCMSYSEIWG